MTFQNATTATNQILGRVAGTQHHQWGIRNTPAPKPLSFKMWFLQGIEHYQKEKGFTFEVLCPGLLRIKRPGQNNLLRTYKDFVREYERDYLPQF